MNLNRQIKLTLMQKSSLLFAILLIFPSLLGCVSVAKEHHFFKSIDRTGNPVNYYRVTVHGSTSFSSSRYLSGFFDEETVDRYFNEFSQPKGGKFLSDPLVPSENKIVSLDKRHDDRKLVVLLSSNSDQIATELGSLAEGKEISGLVAAFAAKDTQTALTKAKFAAGEQFTSGAAVADSGQSIIDGLKADDPQATSAQLLALVNQIATALGGDTRFSSLKEAADWLRFNRSRLIRE